MGDDSLRFLVVEDDEALLRTLTRSLSAYGLVHAVATVASGAEALETHAFHGIVLDITLPDGDGLALARDARTRDPAAHVMVLTGSTNHELIARVHEVGARYLLKPLDLKQIEVFVADTRARRDARDRRTRVTLAKWTSDYGLSPAEADLLMLGASGVSRDEYSRLRGVRPDTIRKQIQILLRKTGEISFESAVHSLLREALDEPT